MNESTNRFRGVLQKLLEKSRKDEVIWEVVRKEPNSRFKVNFPDAKAEIIVEWVSPSVEPDWARAELVVDGSAASQLFAEDGGETGDYELLQELWQDAHRCIFGWDQALEKVENALKAEGTIGAPF